MLDFKVKDKRLDISSTLIYCFVNYKLGWPFFSLNGLFFLMLMVTLFLVLFTFEVVLPFFVYVKRVNKCGIICKNLRIRKKGERIRKRAFSDAFLILTHLKILIRL